MTVASLDIIALIDSATATTCGWCAATLGQGSSSADFCSPEHSVLWHAHQTDSKKLVWNGYVRQAKAALGTPGPRPRHGRGWS
jgi:hypothetical protein